MTVTEAAIRDALSNVIEPELHRDLISLDMVKDINISGNDVSFTIMLTTPACPLKGKMEHDARNALADVKGSGAMVGLLDADILGPNIPMMMGEDKMPPPRNRKMVPAEKFGVKFMSMAFLVKPDQPLVWRGPMLHTAIRQLLTDVDWGELDYLIIDLPPGTGDAQLSRTIHSFVWCYHCYPTDAGCCCRRP